MATTASGWPYVEPADHPVEYPVSSQALANKLETDVGPVFYRAVKTASVDGSGNIILTPAELGMTTGSPVGAVANCGFVASVATSVQFCDARIAGGNVQVRIWKVSAGTSGTLTLAAAGDGAQTVYVVAWK